MKWLNEFLSELHSEFRLILAQFKRGETWLALGLLAGFGLITYIVGRFAFRTDSVLRYLNQTVGFCREMTNGPIIFLFCGMIFFMLTAVLTFGEFQRYFDFRDRGGHYEAQRALLSGIIWGGVSLGISLAALLFFYNYCG
ncbi:MAG: hypothetical protein H6R15_1117 [Proteobacteria bacterium]|nr:hypothetical protein [Pseudomonadota bacterium]